MKCESNLADRADSPWRLGVVCRATVFLLVGFISGLAWFAAQMPVGFAGMVGYDLARYGFAACVLSVFCSLSFRPARQYGLGLYLAGLILGIIAWVALVPMPILTNRTMLASVVLFGGPLVITTFLALGFFLSGLISGSHASPGKKGPPRVTTVPRRFGIGTLMVVVLAVSLLFSGANWLELPPPVSIFAGSFLALIGGLQMMINKLPRAASVAAGAVLMPLTLAATWSTIAGSSRWLSPLVSTFADMTFLGAHLVMFGAAAGYLGGVLVAGLFLVIEMSSRLFRGGPGLNASA